VTNLAAFGVITLLSSADREFDQVRDFAGLARTRPGMAALMTVFLLSLGGFPPTAGFVAKWYVFSAAVQEGYYGLAIVGVLSSVIAVFYYTRIVVMMWMTETVELSRAMEPTRVGMVALAVATIGILWLGILPTSLLDLAAGSIATIF
jgi:NADH-quinone oxidoreductase subunit N